MIYKIFLMLSFRNLDTRSIEYYNTLNMTFILYSTGDSGYFALVKFRNYK
jgi:hypothetical protein